MLELVASGRGRKRPVESATATATSTETETAGTSAHAIGGDSIRNSLLDSEFGTMPLAAVMEMRAYF